MRIDHINIVVADLERAAHFYEHVFGLKRGFAAQLQGPWIETVTGLAGVSAACLFLESETGARLELLRYDSPAGTEISQNRAPNTLGLRHIAFEVSSIDETLFRARELGLEPVSEPTEVPFRVANRGVKRLAYLHDFDGTLVEAASYSE